MDGHRLIDYNQPSSFDRYLSSTDSRKNGIPSCAHSNGCYSHCVVNSTFHMAHKGPQHPTDNVDMLAAVNGYKDFHRCHHLGW